MLLSSATRLGPYEILSLLGAGGMGEVYRARDTRLNRDVALKVLPSEVASDPSRRQRFEMEARAVAALNHPNIVAVYDVGSENGIAYFVSELVDGESLRGVKLGLRKALEIAEQIAAGLACAHEAGIVHRDLKPENILLSREGRAKIVDFGLAKSFRSAAAQDTETLTVHTEPGTVMGTVGYMSPEQVRGAETLGRAADRGALSGKAAWEQVSIGERSGFRAFTKRNTDRRRSPNSNLGAPSPPSAGERGCRDRWSRRHGWAFRLASARSGRVDSLKVRRTRRRNDAASFPRWPYPGIRGDCQPADRGRRNEARCRRLVHSDAPRGARQRDYG